MITIYFIIFVVYMKNNKYIISPEYPRIPHLNSDVSNMTHDDILLDHDIVFPLECWVQEKIDGANMGVSWTDGPILRNRNNILRKGYQDKETLSKIQFRPAWNWVHNHEKDIKKIDKLFGDKTSIYGEWMIAKHSIEYNKLPDLFIAYDIYSVEDREFLSPNLVEEFLSQTKISFIKPHKIIFNSIEEIIKYSEKDSNYKDGIREGIVLRCITDTIFSGDSFKVINKYFERREDFNTGGFIKNQLS